MTLTTFRCNRTLNINELREIPLLMENQETTDKYTSTSIHIDGDYAVIDVKIDKYGNVRVQ